MVWCSRLAFGSLAGRGLIGVLGAVGLAITAYRPSFLATLLDAPSYGVAPIALFFGGMLLFSTAPRLTIRNLIAIALALFILAALSGYGNIAFWIMVSLVIVFCGAFARQFCRSISSATTRMVFFCMDFNPTADLPFLTRDITLWHVSFSYGFCRSCGHA